MRVAILISVLFFTSSCHLLQSNKKPEIRFVDLKGKAKAIEIRKFDSNVVDQKRQESSETRSRELSFESQSQAQKSPSNLSNPLDSSYNFEHENPISPNQIQKGQEGSKIEAENSENNIVSNPKNQSQEILSLQTKEQTTHNSEVAEIDLTESKNDQKNHEEKRDLLSKNTTSSKKYISKNQDSEEFTTTSESNPKLIFESNKNSKSIKKPQNSNTSPKNKNKNVKQGGDLSYYLQVGSFSNQQRAKETVDKMKDFGQGKVESARLGNKKIYRSLIGPFVSKIQAKNIALQIKESGQDAVIVKSN